MTQKPGFCFPAVFFGDLLKLDWRSQINTDLMLHASLLAIWVVWREGATPKRTVLGLLSLLLGAVFGFPYVLIATYSAKGCSWASMLSQSWVPKSSGYLATGESVLLIITTRRQNS